MKKMNGWVIQLEGGVPEIECGEAFGVGWMRDTLRALRAWERRNGIAEGGFRGMNTKLWRGHGRGRGRADVSRRGAEAQREDAETNLNLNT